jgi:SNF2 family DNA or RNA helicase
LIETFPSQPYFLTMPKMSSVSLTNEDDEIFDTTLFFVGPSSISSEADTPISSASDESHGDVRSMEETRSSHSELMKYVAIGALRVHEEQHGLSNHKWIGTYDEDTVRPFLKKRWLVFEHVNHQSHEGKASLRVYALPEDVDRQYRRGSMTDFRRSMKALMRDIDISRSAWNATWDPETHIGTYLEPGLENESLFYIFNTLPSPVPDAMDINDTSGCQSVDDIFEDSVQGLVSPLYPYQKRSAATMIQRETNPKRSQDPRKPAYRDLLGQTFYMDTQDGVLLRQPHLYEEPKGGILAETMGYGKTLICLTVILATRGHIATVPKDRVALLPEPREKVASLLTMAAAAAAHKAVPWKAEFHALSKDGFHHERCINELQKHICEYHEPIFNPTNPSRKGKRASEKVVRLSSATLVVLPPNLVVQWQHELKTHTEASVLDVLVIETDTKKPLPEWQKMIKYDVVIITKLRFEAEYRDNDLHTGKRGRGTEVFQSSLTDIRWLRVICDEGHGFAGSASRTNAMAMLDKLYVERRWVVSGTPANTMLGVEVGLAANETNEETEVDMKKTLQARRKSDAVDQESKDIERLRHMVISFLKVQPWANKKGEIANLRRYLAPREAGGNLRKAASLRVLLQSLIVRHRIEDIEVDLKLPPLYNKVVYLEPSYYDKLSINLFVLVLISNAITSERVDEDYMFHPKNRKTLDILIGNIRQSSFHWVGFREHEIKQTVHVACSYLDNHLDKISDDDGMLLSEAILVGERALADEAWKAFSSLHEIGVYVEDFPDVASQAWSMHSQATKPLLLGTVQARQAQRYIADSSAEDPSEGLTGAGLRAMQAARKRADDEKDYASKTKSNSKASEELKLKQQITASKKRSSSFSESQKKGSSLITFRLKPESPLLKSQIIGFSSAKLVYLIDEVLKHSPTEKIIIFYDSNNIAFWIAEALELVHIPHRIYANTLKIETRAKYLAVFNSSPEIRVLLMDLKQAAHGLHVAAASRVYIVSPIWQPSIESQAIKRAHRIGQTKPVYVETLVLRDTLEDRMLKRRKQMSNVELVKAEKSLLDDGTMGQIIKDEKFLKFTEEEGMWSGRVARLRAPVLLFGRLLQSDVTAGVGVEQERRNGAGQPKEVQKRRKVAFATSLGSHSVTQPPSPA